MKLKKVSVQMQVQSFNQASIIDLEDVKLRGISAPEIRSTSFPWIQRKNNVVRNAMKLADQLSAILLYAW